MTSHGARLQQARAADEVAKEEVLEEVWRNLPIGSTQRAVPEQRWLRLRGHEHGAYCRSRSYQQAQAFGHRVMRRREWSRSPRHHVEERRDRNQYLGSSISGSRTCEESSDESEEFGEIQVLSAASGDELCLLKGFPSWTVRSLKAAIAKSIVISMREQRVLFQGEVLDDDRKLIDLDYTSDRLTVSLVRLSGPDAKQLQELNNWLKGLDDGAGAMLPYADVLATEFDADLAKIAAERIKGGERRGILSAVNPRFWEVVHVKKTVHKMLFARGIARL